MNLSHGKAVPFLQVDAFCNAPFKGNPVAVALHAGQLTDSQMREMANRTNRSQTTFVCESTTDDADCCFRIFTTQFQLPLAQGITILE